MSRTPDEILTDFDAGCQGLADIDMREILHEVIADIADSAQLAIRTQFADMIRQGLPSTPDVVVVLMADLFASEVGDTLENYIVNHYGDD